MTLPGLLLVGSLFLPGDTVAPRTDTAAPASSEAGTVLPLPSDLVRRRVKAALEVQAGGTTAPTAHSALRPSLRRELGRALRARTLPLRDGLFALAGSMRGRLGIVGSTVTGAADRLPAGTLPIAAGALLVGAAGLVGLRGRRAATTLTADARSSRVRTAAETRTSQDALVLMSRMAGRSPAPDPESATASFQAELERFGDGRLTYGGTR